ncbi:MAG: FtsQ-type POTRA domain-containing protein [Clostridia bacterium]|nr:FtsQ-type POTRA domain-containing protein [Clostridia bacterium]
MKETRVEKKRKRRRLYFKVLLSLLILTGLIFFSLKSSFFQLTDIQVIGNEKISKEQILQISKLIPGNNMLLISKSQVEKNIKGLPYAKDVEVKRKWPKSIEISIQERTPYLQFENGYSYAIVDGEGIYLENSIRSLIEIPMVKSVQWPSIRYGDSLIEVDEKSGLFDFFNDEEIYEITNKFKEIVYESEENTKINLINGVLVEFGPLINVKYKLRMLNEIIVDIEKKNIPTRMIIMNKGEHPIVVRDDR